VDLVHKERLRIILGKNNFTAPLDLLLFAVQALQPCQVLTRSQQLLGSGFVPEDSPVLFQKLLQVFGSLNPLLVYFYLGGNQIIFLGSVRHIDACFNELQVFLQNLRVHLGHWYIVSTVQTFLAITLLHLFVVVQTLETA
jgi:hypothetical protein